MTLIPTPSITQLHLRGLWFPSSGYTSRICHTFRLDLHPGLAFSRYRCTVLLPWILTHLFASEMLWAFKVGFYSTVASSIYLLKSIRFFRTPNCLWSDIILSTPVHSNRPRFQRPYEARGTIMLTPSTQHSLYFPCVQPHLPSTKTTHNRVFLGNGCLFEGHWARSIPLATVTSLRRAVGNSYLETTRRKHFTASWYRYSLTRIFFRHLFVSWRYFTAPSTPSVSRSTVPFALSVLSLTHVVLFRRDSFLTSFPIETVTTVSTKLYSLSSLPILLR